VAGAWRSASKNWPRGNSVLQLQKPPPPPPPKPPPTLPPPPNPEVPELPELLGAEAITCPVRAAI
jgi:hypothetical protein